jgi:hypothetical protein
VRYIDFCTKSLKDSELDAEQRSIQKIEGYLGFKKHQLRDLESQEDMAYQLDDFEKRLGDAINVLEDDLMDIEMLLQDALSEATGIFKAKFDEYNKRIIEKTKNLYQSQLQTQTDEFSDELKTHGLAAQEPFMNWFSETYLNNGNEDVPESPRLMAKMLVLDEKETTMQFLDTFKSHLDMGITRVEKDIKQKITDEQQRIEKQVTLDQHKRNRAIVEQIIKTCEKFRRENESYFYNLRQEYDEN